MPKIETPRELAVRTLHENRDAIARAIYKLVAKLAPRWSSIDETAFAKNAGTLLQAAELYLSGGDVEMLFQLTKDMMRVRRLGGFTGADFNVLLHSYMPVVRKVFLSRAPSLREGVAAYDIAESVCLPLFARIIEAIQRVDEQTAPDAQPAFGRPFEEISVDENLPAFMQELAPDGFDDEEEDEPTAPRAQRPVPRSRR